MNTPVTGTWDATYGKAYLGDKFNDATIAITTALTDHLGLVSDLEMKIRVPGGRALSATDIQLSAQEMRELATLLQTAADRVDELEQMRQRIVEQNEVAA